MQIDSPMFLKQVISECTSTCFVCGEKVPSKNKAPFCKASHERKWKGRLKDYFQQRSIPGFEVQPSVSWKQSSELQNRVQRYLLTLDLSKSEREDITKMLFRQCNGKTRNTNRRHLEDLEISDRLGETKRIRGDSLQAAVQLDPRLFDLGETPVYHRSELNKIGPTNENTSSD
jgi:hypothetical protein